MEQTYKLERLEFSSLRNNCKNNYRRLIELFDILQKTESQRCNITNDFECIIKRRKLSN